MCGIFGATKKERFLTLYDLNRKRGTFATSLCLVTQRGDLIIHRWGGTVDSKTVNKVFEKEDNNVVYYLGHTQAPTSSKRKYSKETAHPFNYDMYTVAHNGVLSNFNDLKINLNPKWKNPVDTSIIPFMITLYRGEHQDNGSIPAIVNTLNLLEGTFGLWIYDSLINTTFIARCGSTLFMNAVENEFSSVKFKDSEPVEEGKLYQVTPEGLTSVALFDFDSPFFA